MKQAIRHVFGFTLIELMVAVVVLLAILIAVGRMFSTVITVSASGIAIAETLQQATAIEQQLRADIARVSREGFIAIRHVAVPNDMNGYLLIDDSQPPEAIIRFDQLVFFVWALRRQRASSLGFLDSLVKRSLQKSIMAMVFPFQL